MRTPRGSSAIVWLLALLPSASALATGWSTSAAPTAAQLTAGKEAGEVALWGSVRPPRARQTALWELKLFFKADDDMQEQLGLRRQQDQDDTFGLIAGIAVAGVVASSFIEASSLPPPLKLPLGAFCSLAPFLALLAGVAVPQELQGVVMAFRRRDPAYRQRQNYHEAGHFLIGYLLGLEIERYNAASADGSGAEVSFVSPIASTRTHDAVAVPVAPLARFNEPLTPPCPASAVRMLNMPLDDAVPIPEAITVLPLTITNRVVSRRSRQAHV